MRLYAKTLFLDNLRFPIGKFFEDQWFVPKLLFSEKNVSFIDEELYYYFHNPSGISRTADVEKIKDLFDAYEDNIAFFEHKGNFNMAKIMSQDLLVAIIRTYKEAQRKIFYKHKGLYAIKKYKNYIDSKRLDEAKAIFIPIYRIARKFKIQR